MSYFRPQSFEEGIGTVVGDINDLSAQQRWNEETPVFAEAMLPYVPEGPSRILDYGCGVGRLSREVLLRRHDCSLVGIDSSPVQLAHARGYVRDPRFDAALPHEVSGQFDFAYCVYVLQHVRAVDLRQVVQTIHASLKPGAYFVHCSSKRRMSVRDEYHAFFNDSFLGVNVEREVERLFEPVRDLFDEEALRTHQVVRRMVLGLSNAEEPDDNWTMGEPHPAKVYRKRDISVPYHLLPVDE